jgi:hypothetical protein
MPAYTENYSVFTKTTVLLINPNCILIPFYFPLPTNMLNKKDKIRNFCDSDFEKNYLTPACKVINYLAKG